MKNAEQAMEAELKAKDEEIAELKSKLITVHEQNFSLIQKISSLYEKIDSFGEQPVQKREEVEEVVEQEEKEIDESKLPLRYRVLDYLFKDRAAHKCGHRGIVMMLYIAHKCDLLGKKKVTIDGQEFSAETRLISNDAISINRARCVDAGYLTYHQEHKNRPSEYELQIK